MSRIALGCLGVCAFALLLPASAASTSCAGPEDEARELELVSVTIDGQPDGEDWQAIAAGFEVKLRGWGYPTSSELTLTSFPADPDFGGPFRREWFYATDGAPAR